MSGKIKLLYTIPNFDTAGSGKALLKIATRLDLDHFEPHICCAHDRGEFFKEVKGSGIPVHLFKSTVPMVPRIKGLMGAWKISRLFKRERFDLIHSFHYADDYSEALAAKMSRTKWIYTKKNMSWGSRAWNTRTKLASGIAVQNTDMMREFFPGLEKTKLISRGVDADEFKIQEPAKKLLEEFSIREDTKIILLVANLVPVKGVEVLLKAFRSLSSNNLKLFVVGHDQCEYAESLKAYVQEYSLNDAVIFTGKRMDVKDFHSIADVFVLPTLNQGRQEGSPVSLLEAMASGTYVLASDVAGIRDQLQSFPEQMFIPGNSENLAKKLEEALSLPEDTMKSKVLEQRKLIEEKFSLEREVREHEELYYRVLGH